MPFASPASTTVHVLGYSNGSNDGDLHNTPQASTKPQIVSVSLEDDEESAENKASSKDSENQVAVDEEQEKAAKAKARKEERDRLTKPNKADKKNKS
jgi:hypothetical protein